ncbi:MAG: hypothetical protein EP318_20695 [Rhodobacteraceae bacterium]|nr:MAG: hypothetical protein EP318_20695 [Paracoccaceae bacterium]
MNPIAPALTPALRLAALCLVLWALPGAAAALTFSRTETLPAGCTTLATGPIEPGDLVKLRAVLPGNPGGAPYVETTPRLCLNSTGGDFREGLEMALHLRRTGIATHVAADHNCLGACAIAFLGGTGARAEDALLRQVDRSIHTLATLGFHAPRLIVPDDEFTRGDVIRAYDRAMLATSAVLANLDALTISPAFAGEVFAVPSGRILRIDTVTRTIDVNVKVEGLKPLPAEMSETQLREICERIDPEMRPEHFDRPDSAREFEAVKGMTLSPAPTGARRGAWLSGYWSEGDLYWTVCEVRWLQPADGPGGISARVLQQPAWNGQSGAPREAPPTEAEVETLVDQATGPFTFFEPFAIFPGASRLEDLASDGTEIPATPVIPIAPSLCTPTDSRYKVINVQNFATLREEPGFGAEVIEEVDKDQAVTPIATDASALAILTEACIAACLPRTPQPSETEKARALSCRTSNDVWWLVETAAENRGWMSARYLGQP